MSKIKDLIERVFLGYCSTLLEDIDFEKFKGIVNAHKKAIFKILNETLRAQCFRTGFEDLKIE